MTSNEEIERDEAQEDQGEDQSPSTGSPEPGPSNEAAGRLGSALSILKGRRRILIAGGVGILLSFIAVWGIRIVLLPGDTVQPKGPTPGPLSQQSPAATGDRLLKQELKPFYILLPQEKTGKIARLRLSVTWAPKTAARYQEKEILIRDRLYRRITELASKGENIRGMTLTIRAEAQNILEELLRPNELRVAVAGIFVV
jgi:hypothetical protein